MKKIIFNTFINLSIILIDISLKTNSPKLSALIIWLNIRKFKEIKFTNKNVKKILFFPKSGGNEDLIESFRNKKRNIIFYSLPRIFLKKIYHHHFKGTNKSKNAIDYSTKMNNVEEFKRKKLYVEYLTNVLKYIKNFLKLDSVISFNLFYYAEKFLEESLSKINIKFIVLHKESVFTLYEETIAEKFYRNQNEKSLASKILVYSNNQKEMLIKSGIAKNKQIEVIGCPRLDSAFRLRRITPQDKIIIFYLIESRRNQNNVFFSKNVWSSIYNKTLKSLLNFAKNNKDVKLILKGKAGVHKREDFKSMILPNNCFFIEGGSGEGFLKNASVVIAFNSTIVFETIAANRNLIIPNFDNQYIKKQKFLHKIGSKKYFINSNQQLNDKLNSYLNTKYINRKLSLSDKKTIKYYLGNTDGNSAKRFREILTKILNKK